MTRDTPQRIATMVQRLKFYIDGAWQDPVFPRTLPVTNPANEEVLYEIALGSKADLDKAVAAARRAFATYSLTSREERVNLLAKIVEVYKKRMKEVGGAISDEMGAPLVFAEILHEAGVPKGVFNLINGLGPEVGAAMSEHPDIDMMSFTGSTRAGVDVVKRAAVTVKRVTQELGGKSPNIILEDADMAKAVAGGTTHCFNNSGQSCNAPTRMLVPLQRMAEATAIAKAVADKTKVGDPKNADTNLGPVVNRVQWDKIQALIKKGIDEGATLAAGGLGLPDGLNKGYYVRPTVFSHVTNDMTIAREEIFGPVLSIIGYKDEDDAIRIANDTPYGLAGYVSSGNLERARQVARRLRAGNVNLNGAANERGAPFGGYKHSGNGREWGRFGLEEYLEVKAVAGWGT